MAQRIPVPFAGDDSGDDELTWGQQNIWGAMRRSGGALNMSAVMTVRPERTLDDTLRMLAFVTSRHQALRTRLRFTAEGRPRQAVAGRGETSLEVIDVEDVDPVELVRRYDASEAAGDVGLVLADPDRPSPEEVAEAVRMRHLDPFDEEHDWPVRMTLVRSGGELAYLVATYNHRILDGEGLAALVRDLSTMDRDTGRSAVPVAGLKPLDLARLQRTRAHVRLSDSALRCWDRLLRTVPARRFTGPLVPQRPRFWELEFVSPAALLALRTVAARTNVDTGPVLLAAFATALYRVTGTSPSVVQMHVNNRFRPGFAESVSPLNQPAPCAIDVAAVSFDEAVAAAWRCTMTAGMHGYYDMSQYDELKAELGRERGEELDLSCYYNDRRMETRLDEAAPVPTPRQILDAVPETVLRWRRRLDRPNERLYFHVNDSPDALDIMLAGDTMYLAPDDMTRLVRELEAVVVEAATESRCARFASHGLSHQ